MSISVAQVRAALGLIGLKQVDLASGVGVTRQTLSRYLAGHEPAPVGLKKIEEIRCFFENTGIEFIEHNGVRKKPTGLFRLLRGNEGFKEFIYDVYETVKDEGGHICVSNVDERQFERWQGVHADDYLAKMAAVSGLTFQILVREGDHYHTASDYAEYRHLPVDYFSGVPTYIYGSKKAEIIFGDDDVTIFLFENAQLAEAQRKQFKVLWEKAVA